MSTALLIAALVAMAGVVLTLLIGVFAMGRGGAWNKAHGNRLMRARVAFQVLAVVLLIAATLAHSL